MKLDPFVQSWVAYRGSINGSLFFVFCFVESMADLSIDLTEENSNLVSQWWVSSDIFTKIDVLQKSPTVGTRISTYYPFVS